MRSAADVTSRGLHYSTHLGATISGSAGDGFAAVCPKWPASHQGSLQPGCVGHIPSLPRLRLADPPPSFSYYCQAEDCPFIPEAGFCQTSRGLIGDARNVTSAESPLPVPMLRAAVTRCRQLGRWRAWCLRDCRFSESSQPWLSSSTLERHTCEVPWAELMRLRPSRSTWTGPESAPGI